MQDHVELKRLQSQLSQERDKLKSTKRTATEVKQQVSQHENRIDSLSEQISRLTEKRKKVVVSEHAMLRYLEHVKGIDMEALKKEIMSEDTEKLVVELGGNGKFPIKDKLGCKVVVKKYAVVTVLGKP